MVLQSGSLPYNCEQGRRFAVCLTRQLWKPAGSRVLRACASGRAVRTGELQKPCIPGSCREAAAQAAVLAEGDALWDPAQQAQRSAVLRGRGANAARYKPGSEEALLAFGDRAGGRALRFPPYARLRAALEPVLEQVTGSCRGAASFLDERFFPAA